MRGTREFRQIEITGLPRSVRTRDREFLARNRDETEAAADETRGDGPGLETLMTALEGRGLDRRQLLLCQQFLTALPEQLENQRLSGAELPQTTWKDVENLLVRAVRHRSFEKAAAVAQRMAIEKDLGDLMSVFEEIVDDQVEHRNWREALDLLLALNRRTVSREVDAEVVEASNGVRPFAGDQPSIARLCEAVSEIAGTPPPSPSAILPDDHREELALLLQMLQFAPSLPAQSRLQRRLDEIVGSGLDQDRVAMIARGVASLVAMPAIEHRDAAIGLVLETIRRRRRGAVAALVVEVGRLTSAGDMANLWPHVVNELLMAGPEVGDPVLEQLAALVRRWPGREYGPDARALAYAEQATRLAGLEAMHEGRLVQTAATRVPADLRPVFGHVLAAVESRALGAWLLEHLRADPGDGPGRWTLPLLGGFRSRDHGSLVELLLDAGEGAPSVSLREWGAAVATTELPKLPARRRGEAWVPEAVAALAHHVGGAADQVLAAIVAERRLWVLPAWPAACRRAAREAMARRPGDGRDDHGR
jgi:hypothetical protein